MILKRTGDFYLSEKKSNNDLEPACDVAIYGILFAMGDPGDSYVSEFRVYSIFTKHNVIQHPKENPYALT